MVKRPVSNKLKFLAVLALLVCAGVNARGQQSYTAINLGALPGGSYSQATGINNSGQVVGGAEVASQAYGTVTHAFLYSGGCNV